MHRRIFTSLFATAGKVSVDLETLTITEGKVKPREVKAALDWAREHKALLWEKWKEYAE